MEIKWNFPNNNGGQIRGIADAGIETFKGKEIVSLARETCQNSLDAADKKYNKPVKVKFYMHRVAIEAIPDVQKYIDILKKCQKSWSSNEKVRNFTSEALKTLESKSIKNIEVLRISDYNTTGLKNPYDVNSMEGWNTLTKIDGGATKRGKKDGAFGIGKNAPFCNSIIRMVFYRTYNKAGDRAAQGMSRIVSYYEDLNNNKSMTTGIGYYGDVNGNLPVENIQFLTDLDNRIENGTDVFVIAFKNKSLGDENWRRDILKEILNNYIVSIMNNKLVVEIHNLLVDKSRIKGIISEYKSKVKDAMSCYKLLTNNEKVIEFRKEFQGLGSFKLRILHDPNDDTLNKRVLVCRPSGMKLFFHKAAPVIPGYTGLLEMEGNDLIKYFGEMENPSHTAWNTTRHSKPKEARHYLEELSIWLKDTISSLYSSESTEELEVYGLSQNLQMSLEVENSSDQTDGDGFKEVINKIELDFFKNTPTQRGYLVELHGNKPKAATSKDKIRKEKGDITKNGDFSAIRKLSGTRKRKTRDSHRGVPSINGENIINVGEEKQNINKGNEQPLKKVRVYKFGQSFRLSFEVPKDISKGNIEIRANGENGKSAKMLVKDASSLSGIEDVTVNNGRIHFIKVKSEKRATIEFSLKINKIYGMAVVIYENR